MLRVSLQQQFQWSNASIAFDAWRSALEALGATVVQYPIGARSCRGFSLWDERCPLIAVNTAWRDEARVFSLFHELGHLITRTNSACPAQPVLINSSADPAERWCETFSAALLIPADSLQTVDHVDNMTRVVSLARRYRVSLRAMALRLIDLQKATWDLYEAILPASDAKPHGGGGGGRNRREIREDEIGRRSAEVFVSAVEREIISQSQALDYLDIPAAEFDRLAGRA
jgi:Zn-dependent peptidase ImmA (M78 family)